jgi:hypothetical protein
MFSGMVNDSDDKKFNQTLQNLLKTPPAAKPAAPAKKRKAAVRPRAKKAKRKD